MQPSQLIVFGQCVLLPTCGIAGEEYHFFFVIFFIVIIIIVLCDMHNHFIPVSCQVDDLLEATVRVTSAVFPFGSLCNIEIMDRLTSSSHELKPHTL